MNSIASVRPHATFGTACVVCTAHRVFLSVLLFMQSDAARSAPEIGVEQSDGQAIAHRVVVWGDGSAGQLILPAGVDDVTAVAGGDAHVVALTQPGAVVVWGDNTWKQKNVPAGLTGVTGIAAGGGHTLALRNDGTVAAWGYGFNGQENVPVGLKDVSAIAAGGSHSAALKTDGTVVAWGSNDDGQSTPPAGLAGVAAIAAGWDHTIALKSDGTVVAWGYNGSGQANVPIDLVGVTAVAGGLGHTVALRTDGKVIAWGGNIYGETSVPIGLSGIVSIAAGESHTLALRNDGRVVAWGSNSHGQATVPAGLVGVTAIAASGQYSIALQRAVDFGTQTLGATTAPRSLAILNTGTEPLVVSNVVLVDGDTQDFRLLTSEMPAHLDPLTGRSTVSVDFTPRAIGRRTATLRILSDDADESTFDIVLTGSAPVIPAITIEQPLGTAINERLLAWGSNRFGQIDPPLGLTGVTSIATGREHNLALKSDGTVVAWGRNDKGQTNVPEDLVDVKAIAAGYAHSVALRADGSLVIWGSNDFGEQGAPGGLTNVTASAAGLYNTFALKEDGTIVAWGDNNAGQTAIPAGLAGVKAVTAGLFHTAAVKNDGTVVAWGYNRSNQATVPSGLSGVIATVLGDRHTLALKGDGSLSTWGENSDNQTRVPAGLAGVKAIAAGAYFSVALRANGTVAAWGRNDLGQTSVPTGLIGLTAVAAGESHTLAFESGRVDYGSQPVTNGASKTFAVRNSGAIPLLITSVSTTGNEAGDFSVSTEGMTATIPPNGTTSFTVRFAPSAIASHSTTLRLLSSDPIKGTFDIPLAGTGVEPTFGQWAEAMSLSGVDAHPGAMPHGDGVPNLLKFAFNLDGSRADSSQLTPGTGLRGLPAVSVGGAGFGKTLRVEFLRRRNAGLTYTPQLSSSLSAFVPMLAPPAITVIDAAWERVVVEQPLGDPSPPSLFARVRVVLP